MYFHGPNSAFESETFGKDLSFHIQQPVGSMSISPCARDVVLASKEGLHIIDLDYPFSPPRHLPHRTSWEVADVQWSPFAARDFWVISTSNQKALVWNLGFKSWQDPVEFVLHGHTRAITDINFSAHHPDVLATCAVDSFVHCWDLRVPARPVISFSDWFAGATQVKWNRQVSHMIASSHDKYLRIWDDRMGAYPVRSIEAHDTKIYGIDWNRHEQNRIVTCSLDKSIKSWDCTNLSDVPERVITTHFPAWRTRHTPFGWGLLAMPERGDSDLHLYDHRPVDGHYESGAVPAAARFEGHKGQVKEFLWRPRGTIVDGIDHREFQLVTWGTDQELRLHRMIPETLSATGYENGVTRVSKLNFTRSGAKYRTYRNEPSEEIFDEVFDFQAGSSPAAGQSFHSRPRGSTSVGMSKVGIRHPQGWLQGSNITARIGMHGRTDTRQIMNPIDWMKNVKITSKNPELLGEEISRVGKRFAKVTFESVDVPQRKAVISMQSPCAPSKAPIFVKLDIKFPIAYPREAAAIFNVQRTSGMTDQLANTLSTGLQAIAETYVARKRGCLEAVLRYLLQEQNMEQIESWLDESSEDSKIVDDVGFDEEVSSDEDDVGATNFQGRPGANNSSELLNANMLVPVPRVCGAIWSDNGKLVCFFPAEAKQAIPFLELFGAGRHDADKSDNIFEGFGRLKTDSPGARTTIRTATSGEDMSSELLLDASSSSSSSSGSSDNLASLPTRFFPRNGWRAGGVALQLSGSAERSTLSPIGLSNDKPGAESSTHVVSIHDLSELLPSKKELAMEYLIFGKGPDVCGYNAEVAMRHGYEDIAHIWGLIKLVLADNVSLDSLTNWDRSTDILVIARSASDVFKGNDSGVDLSYDKMISKPRAAIPGRVRWGEGAPGGKYLVPALIRYFESLGDIQMLAMLSCVFAEPTVSNRMAISSQEQYHDQAMHMKAPAFSLDYHPSLDVARAVIERTSTTSFPLVNTSTKATDPSHARPVDKIGRRNPTTPYFTGTTPPNLAQSLYHRPNGRRRSVRLSSADVRDHPHSDLMSTTHSGAVSLSASPEEPRLRHRSNMNLATSFSRAGPSALAPSFVPSPPKLSGGSGGNKKPSPVGSLMVHHLNAGGWNTPSIFGGPGSGRGRLEVGARGARSRGGAAQLGSSTNVRHSPSISSDGDAMERTRGGGISSVSSHGLGGKVGTSLQSTLRNGTKRKVKIHSALHNQNMFDADGYARVSLLEPRLEWKHRAYRASYARLLGVWVLPIQQAEVLKFDGLPGYLTAAAKETAPERFADENDLTLGNELRRRTLVVNKTNFAQGRGLELRRRCHQCGAVLVPVEKNGIPIGWHCAECAVAGTKGSIRTLCAICTNSIAGLMVPCLNCRHATCFECHWKWLARDSNVNTTDDATLDPLEPHPKPCPTGCGCVCSWHQFVTVPYPLLSEDEAEQDDGGSQCTAHPLSAPETTEVVSTHDSNTAVGAFLSLSQACSILPTTSASEIRKPNLSFPESPERWRLREESERDVGMNEGSKHKNTDPGKGLGAGLARATTILRERGSDMTIRKESEAEARLRRAGSMYV